MTHVMKILLVFAASMFAIPCLGQEGKQARKDVQNLRFEGAEAQTLQWETGRKKTNGQFKNTGLETAQFNLGEDIVKTQSTKDRLPVFGPGYQSIKVKPEESKSEH